MRLRGRSGASAYVEVFVLISIAAGGSALVLEAAIPSVSSLPGPSVSVQDEGIHQGAYLAIVRLTVMNPGMISIASFDVSTSQVPTSSSYCYAVYDIATAARSAGTCPVTAGNPSSVTIDYPVKPGGAARVVITIFGQVFGIGSTCTITVTTSEGAQQTVGVLVAPA